MKKSQSYRKPYRIRKKRSILKNRFFWLGILFAVLCTGVFYLIYFLPYIQIKEVNIFNNNKVPSEEIKNLAWQSFGSKILFFDSKSILLLDSSKIKNSILQKYPQIDKAVVKKIFPDKLSIDIYEREPFGLFCKADNNCWYFDRKGIAFEQVFNNLIPMIKMQDLSYGNEVRLGDKVISEESLGKIENINNKIINDLKINISQFVIPSQGRLNVQTLDGWEIYFDFLGNLDWQAMELATIFQKEIPPEKVKNLEYIDLRFSKVFYKYK